MTEEWRPIRGYEGIYSVSNLGQVRGHQRIGPSRWPGSTRLWPGRLLKLEPFGRHGHLRARLSKKGKSGRFLIHHLVLNAFVGPRPEGMECRHLDGNPVNNALSNLAWGTPQENWKDKFRHGRVYVRHSTNTSGMQGVSYDKRLKKWHTYIGYKPRQNLGWFSNFDDAVKVRLQAEQRITAAMAKP